MFRRALLVGAVLAALSAQGRALGCGCPIAAPSAAPCAPALRTVTVTEWVPQQFETTRTVYRTEYVNEKFTAFRTVCVPQTQTRMVTVSRMVPECRQECRTVWKCVPSVETRTTYKTVTKCVPVTTVCRKCVDMGHYECREVPCGPSLWERLCHKKCDPCDPCCCPPPPRTKTVKVWCPNKVWVETPVTKMKRVSECVPVTCQVTVMRKVPSTETFNVTVMRCVSEQVPQTCTVMVPQQVPYEACRTVAKCVPTLEKVMVCRMVPHQVQKVVAEDCGASPCATGAPSSMFRSCCH